MLCGVWQDTDAVPDQAAWVPGQSRGDHTGSVFKSVDVPEEAGEVENPRSWIFRVAANTGRNWLKKKMMIEQHMRAQQQPEDVHDLAAEAPDLRTIANLVQATIRFFPRNAS